MGRVPCYEKTKRSNMGRALCSEKKGLKKGNWTPEEDKILVDYIKKNGHGSWSVLPKLAGLLRCGKSCRLRWTNYLRPDIKRGSFTEQEERTIIQLHAVLGNRWSTIASQLPGRTDNEIKNYWTTNLKKRLLKMGLDPSTHAPIEEVNPASGYESLSLTRHKAQWENARLQAEARFSRESLIMSSHSTFRYHTNNTSVENIPNKSPPADYFLKIWNSKAGNFFRKESRSPNGGGDDPGLSSEIPVSSASSLCCVSTENCWDQPLSPNIKDSQQCDSASFEWIEDINVKTPEPLSYFADMTAMSQTEDKTAEKLAPEHLVHYSTASPELPLDFCDKDENPNNSDSIQSELSRVFEQPSSSPFRQLHGEDYWINMLFLDHQSGAI